MKEARALLELPLGSRMWRGFTAGFLSALIFHQTTPLGVPAVFTLAFWGGIWGVVYVLIHKRFSDGAVYWAAAFLFGAVFPTLASILIVLLLKGFPVGTGMRLHLLISDILINGAWGVCTGLSYRFIFQHFACTSPMVGECRQPSPYRFRVAIKPE